jgi:hypothetical protein
MISIMTRDKIKANYAFYGDSSGFAGRLMQRLPNALGCYVHKAAGGRPGLVNVAPREITVELSGVEARMGIRRAGSARLQQRNSQE